MTKLSKAAALALLAGSIALAGCSGSDGNGGAQGPAGADGAPGADGADGQDGIGLASPAIPTLVVNDVVFGVDATNHVTARFSVTDGSAWVTGLTTSSTTLYLAGLIPGTSGSSDEWQAWPSVAAATVTEGPAGTYLLVSNKLAADAPATSTTQRGVVRLAKAGFNMVVKGYDFAIAAPATPVAWAKDVVNDASCKECHGFGVTIHSYGRNDTRTCVICHSPRYDGNIAAHEADMVTMIHQIHTNKAATLGALHPSGHGENWPTLKYPGTMLACTKCHNTVAQADNWKTKPTRVACDSCHTTIRFDGSDYVGILGTTLPTGEHHTESDDSACASCHGPGKSAAVDQRHRPSAADDASLRTMEAVISGATIDANGLVTVAFRVTDAGAPVTDPAAFSGLSFTLAKLVPARGDAPSYWQSYLSQARTKVASKLPVVQGRTEAYPADGGTLTQVGSSNVYVYAFALKNASTPGDIRTIDHVHNSSTVAGAFNQANLPTLRFVVPYEPTRTHRIAMAFNKELGANDIANKWNAHLDFVPAGGSAETRNIVSRTACNRCHGDSKLHNWYSLEYCVGCHNQNSFDPFSGADPTGAVTVTDTVSFGSSSVALERIVHKIHMGKGLAYGFVLNGPAHDYSRLQYPGGVPSSSSTPSPRDCTMCHVEPSPGMTDAAKWKSGNRACGSCHDDLVASAHIAANTFDPTPSTSPLGAFSGDEVEACSICHAPGGLAPVDAAHLGALR